MAAGDINRRSEICSKNENVTDWNVTKPISTLEEKIQVILQ
jgi:hypothetical protein